jgi:hypothetical protein
MVIRQSPTILRGGGDLFDVQYVPLTTQKRAPSGSTSIGRESPVFAPIWSPKVGEKQQRALAGLIPDRTPGEKLGAHLKFQSVARYSEEKRIHLGASRLSCSRSHACIVQNMRVASVRAARRKLVKLFKKAKSKFYWYDFTVRGHRYRASIRKRSQLTELYRLDGCSPESCFAEWYALIRVIRRLLPYPQFAPPQLVMLR